VPTLSSGLRGGRSGGSDTRCEATLRARAGPRTAATSQRVRLSCRWRPGRLGDASVAVAPWLCAAAFRRLCSEQRLGTRARATSLRETRVLFAGAGHEKAGPPACFSIAGGPAGLATRPSLLAPRLCAAAFRRLCSDQRVTRENRAAQVCVPRGKRASSSRAILRRRESASTVATRQRASAVLGRSSKSMRFMEFLASLRTSERRRRRSGRGGDAPAKRSGSNGSVARLASESRSGTHEWDTPVESAVPRRPCRWLVS
jgi:hypothetical protein